MINNQTSSHYYKNRLAVQRGYLIISENRGTAVIDINITFIYVLPYV